MGNIVQTEKPINLQPYNRFVYGVFTLLGLYLLLVKNDFSNSVIYLRLALAFDPFNVSVTYTKRPAYQQIWPIIQLALVLVCFGFIVASK